MPAHLLPPTFESVRSSEASADEKRFARAAKKPLRTLWLQRLSDCTIQAKRPGGCLAAGGPNFTHGSTALFGETFLGAVVERSVADASWLVGFWADRHDL